MRIKHTMAGLSLLVAVVGIAGCGNSASDNGGSSSPSNSAASAPSSPESAPTTSSEASGPFGSACSAVPSSGPGSFTGMSADPVATAASNNPVLSTLVSAVKKAGLVDTLNSAKNITVFAPANSAFAKLPAATLNKVLADKKTLTKILTYHVVGQTITPSDLATGNFKTLEGDMVTTTGSGQDYTVNNTAHIICGNVHTANATVYIIDSVLMPPTH